MKKIIFSLSFMIVLVGVASINYFKDSIGVNVAMAQGTNGNPTLPGTSGITPTSQHKYETTKSVTTVTQVTEVVNGQSLGGGVSAGVSGASVSVSYNASTNQTTITTTTILTKTEICCEPGSAEYCEDFVDCV